MSTRAPRFYDFLHFKGCSYLNHKISCNLSCTLTIFLAFHNLFMILVHMEVHSKYHLLMVHSIQIRSGVKRHGSDWFNLFIGQFPFIVSLQYKNKHNCGGTIISKNHILSAAHCFLNVDINPRVYIIGCL